MRLLLLNDTYFGASLKREDVEILRVGPGVGNDLRIDPDREDLEEVLARVGFVPDAILQVDSIDQRVFFRGLDRFNVPVAFYAIDSPINDFWQRYYAHMFDRIWVDQHDTWRAWSNANLDWVRWLPLAADSGTFHPPVEGSERDLPIVFVGTLDRERRPKRSAILFRLNRIAPVTVVDGGGNRSVPPEEVADYYRRARVVLNELLFDGCNLRTFEAMACGAAVLTEEGRGEDILFEPGKNLVTFSSSNLEDVVSQLVANPEATENVGREAAELVMERHTLQQRAAQVLREMDRLSVRPERLEAASRLEAAWGIWQASWKWDYLGVPRSWAEETLSAHFKELDWKRKAMLLEARGQRTDALQLMEEMMQHQAASPSLKVSLAGMLLEMGDTGRASRVLDLETNDAEAVHVAIGDLLMHLGQDLTPGFNRGAGPVSAWTAFEHYRRAYSLNEDNLKALQGLDRVLMSHKSPEFTLALWQRYHARHPRDEESRTILSQRAKDGYFMPMPTGEGAGRAAVPFRTDSRRTGDRTRSSGPSARKW